MIETALVDGDIVAYRCAAVTEKETEDIACWQTSQFMQRILHETNAMGHRCFLTGSNNFRYSVYPDYKANRKDVPKPKWLSAVREHLVKEWGASVTDGIEADDALGIEQCLSNDNSTVIVSIDKDLLMIPGQHYSFEISGTGSTGKEWVRPAEWRIVSPLMGLRHFYTQLIMGDKADHIPGFDGKMRVKVPQFLEGHIAYLEECFTEREMFDHVAEMYKEHSSLEQMIVNGKVLWIMQKEEDFWQEPPPANIMEDTGPKEDFIRL